MVKGISLQRKVHQLALISAFLRLLITQLKISAVHVKHVEQFFVLCLDIEEESYECVCNSESEDKNK